MMKKYILIVCLILSTIVFCSYKYYKFGVYTSDVHKVKQEFDDWCFYAVAEMATWTSQCEFASHYAKWKKDQDHIMDPTELDCCLYGATCGGVALKRCIDYWNYIYGDEMRRWNNISSLFNKDKSKGPLPRFGLLDLRDDSHDSNYHAIWVFRVEIEESDVFTTYEVLYIDPWTGTIGDRVTKSTSGTYSTVYVME